MPWNDEDRELVLWSSYGSEESSRGVSQFGGLQDSNQFTLLPQEAMLYAYFDSLEREDPLTTHGPLGTFVRNYYGPRNEIDPELLIARFDCVGVPYFNNAVDVFRSFYAQVRGENVDGEHDVEKEYWHSGEQTDLHVTLLDELFKQRAEFGILYLVYEWSEAAETLLDVHFASEGWIGLGITATSGKTPLVAIFDHDDDQLQKNFRVAQLSSIVTLSEKRLNNLRHVFSVDFATDALMPPDDPDEPVPTPTPSTSRYGKWSKRSRKKILDKLFENRTQRSVFKPKIHRQVRRQPVSGLHVPRLKILRKTTGYTQLTLQNQGIRVY